MAVTIQYHAQIRRAVGVAEESVELGGQPLAALISRLAERHPAAAGLLVDASGQPSRSLLFFVDDAPADVDSIVPDGAVVTILAPMAGGSPANRTTLTDHERAVYEWQIWTPGFGEQGQENLKNASVLVSRIGGVGGVVALELAAAGVGRLVLAHAGNARPSDLNRQILMSHAGLGQSRVDQAARRLGELNPRVEIRTIPENVSADNAAELIADVDVVASCAPLFSERLAMNRAAATLRKPLVDCAMYDLEFQLLTVRPGGPCLECLYPEAPAAWKREFPVFGAVAGTAGCLGALEVIKVVTGIAEPLDRHMLLADLATWSFRKIPRRHNPECPACRPSKGA